MEKQIKLHDREIKYTLRTSRKARRMRLVVSCDGSLTATKPFGISENAVERFILEKSKWIFSKIDYFKKSDFKVFGKGHRKYPESKSDALKFVGEKISHFNKLYNFRFNKINIKNQKTRWGSCSGKGNLNFNYKILFLPARAADYIVVHELCHLKEMNHSKKFWNLVAQAVPDWLEVRKELKKTMIGH
jgi:hypothetical protein